MRERGEKKRFQPRFSRENEKHSRCIEKRGSKRSFPTYAGNSFRRSRKKKEENGKRETWKMIYRDWRAGGEEGKGSSRVHATRRHDLHSSSLIRVLDNRDVTEYYLIESVSHSDRYIWERDALSLPRCVTTNSLVVFFPRIQLCSLSAAYFRCKFSLNFFFFFLFLVQINSQSYSKENLEK